MNKIYFENYKLIKKYCKNIFDEIEEYKNSKEIFDVYTYETQSGRMGLYLDYSELGIVQLGSQYHPEEYAKVWADKWIEYKSFEPNSTIICFGIGSGEYIKELYSRLGEDNLLVIYEPSLKILDNVIRNIDLTEILSDRVVIVSGTEKGKRELYSLLCSVVKYSYFSLVRYYDLPNYPRIFSEQYKEYKQMIMAAINRMTMNVNTYRSFSKVSYINVLYSLEKTLDACSLNSLYEQLPDRKPGIIISAGPSLERNIEELKRAKGKALLIATDTALKPLLKHNIKPDIYATIDPNKWLELFDDDRIKNIPVIATFKAKKDVIEANKNKVFFEYGDPVFQKIIKRIDDEEKYTGYISGGSVATTAFSFLIAAKMSPIIFVGQDLAYTDNKKHVEGAFEEDQSTSEEEIVGAMYVEGIDGEKVLTDVPLNNFRLWFEDEIPYYPGHKFIDATEGGAKIAGTEIMTLKDVIDNECTDNIDYEKIISDSTAMLEGDVRKKYYQELLKFGDELEEIKNVCNELLEAYKKVDELSGQEVIKKDDLIELFAKIKKHTTYIDNDTVVGPLLDDYMAVEDAFSDLHGEKVYDDVHEELADISKRAIMKVQSLLNGVEGLRPFIKEFVERIEQRYHKEYDE